MKQGTPWTDEQIRLLGTMRDREVATLVQCSVRTVLLKRRTLGVPAWSQGHLSESAVLDIRRRVADGETTKSVARRWKVTRQEVSHIATGRRSPSYGGPISAPKTTAERVAMSLASPDRGRKLKRQPARTSKVSIFLTAEEMAAVTALVDVVRPDGELRVSQWVRGLVLASMGIG